MRAIALVDCLDKVAGDPAGPTEPDGRGPGRTVWLWVRPAQATDTDEQELRHHGCVRVDDVVLDCVLPSARVLADPGRTSATTAAK